MAIIIKLGRHCSVAGDVGSDTVVDCEQGLCLADEHYYLPQS